MSEHRQIERDKVVFNVVFILTQKFFQGGYLMCSMSVVCTSVKPFLLKHMELLDDVRPTLICHLCTCSEHLENQEDL